MDKEQEETARKERELYMRSLQDVLKHPSGFIILQELLKDLNVFCNAETPEALTLRRFGESFFTDIEIAEPGAAIKLFIGLRELETGNR